MPLQTTRQRDLVAILLVFFLWGLFVWPFFTPNVTDRGSLPLGDVDSQYYALAHLAAKRLGAGEMPLWNPYSFGGSAFLAEPQAALLYPPRWITLLVGSVVGGRGELPFIVFELELFLHLLLAALLTFAFLRQLSLSRRSALIGAVVFAFSSFLTGYPLEQVSILEAAVWLPGVLWGIELGLAGRRRGWWVTTAMLALSFLAGSTQITLYIGYTALLYQFFRGHQVGWAWKRLAFHAGGWAVAAFLLTLAQSWPTLELMRLSPRASANFATVGNGLNPKDLLELLIPHTTSIFAPLYVGLLPLLLAVSSFYQKKTHPTTFFWLGLGASSLALAFGSHAAAFGWGYLLLPGFDLFRSQERIILLWVFALAVLSALGVNRLLHNQSYSASQWRSLQKIGSHLLFLLTLSSLITYLQEHLALPGFVFATLITIGAVLILTLKVNQITIHDKFFFLVVLLLVVFDLFSLNGRTVWRSQPPEQHEQIPELVIPLLEEPPPILFDIEGDIQPNIGAFLSLPATSGASQLRLSRYERAASTLSIERWWQLWGVSHVVTWREQLALPAERLNEIKINDEMRYLYRLTAPSPRASLHFSTHVIPDEEALWARLADPAHDPATTLLLDRAPVELVGSGTGTIKTLHIGPESWQIQVESDSTAYLRLSLPFYPGWRAFVSQTPTPLVRADALWSALPIPTGSHTVRIEFVPVTWAIAALISLMAWVIWALSGLYIGKKKKDALITV